MSGQDAVLEFLHPRHWKRAKGYANGVAGDGRLVLVAGQIGWNADQQFESRDFVAQVRQALENVLYPGVGGVAAAGATPAHIARLTWYITDRQDYLSRLPEVGEAYRGIMGRHFPAMTMVEVSALMEGEAKVEIEATAVVPRRAGMR
jgi:enamine deaminase RidA (YjgF/YER057c/UK114 family)